MNKQKNGKTNSISKNSGNSPLNIIQPPKTIKTKGTFSLDEEKNKDKNK